MKPKPLSGIEWILILSILVMMSLVVHGALTDKPEPILPKPSPIVHASEPQPCPKRILVGAYTYALIAADPGKGRDGKPLAASVNYQREVILVDPDQPRDLKTEAIVHELEHVAAQQSLQRTADYFFEHTYRDDQWIEATAPILTATLRKYPELLTCEVK